jgi:hypothetical protein
MVHVIKNHVIGSHSHAGSAILQRSMLHYCVTPPNSNHTSNQNSDPKLRTPNWTATPTGPRLDRTAPYASPRPIETLPAGPIVTTTEVVDKAGQLGGMTE